MKKLCVFKIFSNIREVNQKEGRDEIIKLLKIIPLYFKLEKLDGKFAREIFPQEFVFETMEEARNLAIELLKTHTIFFCELNEVKTK